MTDWTEGYVADIGYTYGYYNELNPLRVRLAFLESGLMYPQVKSACELGFGQGISVNIHAAASDTNWYGTDFNPSHASFASELAQASGTGALISDDSFSEFAQRTDLPEFDYIGLHGIWSWISNENRTVLVDFIRRKLKVGGVLYMSYNTMPGWSSFAPMRHLMSQHAEVMGSSGEGSIHRVDSALAFIERFLAAKPLYATANSQVEQRIKRIGGQSRAYLAHEFFNRDWEPMYFADMVRWLMPAKVSYACSAHYIDLLDDMNLTKEQKQLLDEVKDSGFRQSLRDFMVNQQFRRDYWVRGPRRLTALEQIEAMREQRIVLTTNRADVPLKIKGVRGEANMNETICNTILDCLADYQPKSIEQIEQAVKEQGLKLNNIISSIIGLAGSGHISPVQDEASIENARPRTEKLNAYLLNLSRANLEIKYLASPVTGGGIPVIGTSALFLLAFLQGKKDPSEWPEFVWSDISSRGQKMIRDGKALESPEENLEELREQAQKFASIQLPILKALQVV